MVDCGASSELLISARPVGLGVGLGVGFGWQEGQRDHVLASQQ